MSPDIIAPLIILALIDATSIGTLLIPLWLLLRQGNRRKTGRILSYLAVLGTFYLVVGLLVLGGASALLDPLIATDVTWDRHPAPRWVALLAGAAMLVWALAQRPAAHKAAKQVPATVGPGAHPVQQEPAPGPNHTWSKRMSTALSSRSGVIALAFLAGLLELPTMLPYLGAVGILSTSKLTWAASAAALTGYCLVMLAPALLLLLLSTVAGRRLDALLKSVERLATKASGDALWWVVGIAGFLLMRWGLVFLFPEAPWNPFK